MASMYHHDSETSAAALLPEEIAALPEVTADVHANIIFRAAHDRLSAHLRHEFRFILSRHRRLLERPGITVINTFSDRDGNLKLKVRLWDGAAVESVVLVDRKSALSTNGGDSGATGATNGMDGISDAGAGRANGNPVNSYYDVGRRSGAPRRKTLCLSTQVGCAIGCTFCKTGQLGFYRNLSTEEIVEQLLIARERFGRVSNIVFMGMGEPLLNIDNVLAATRIFAHPHGPSVALKRITVSTCGIPSAIDRLTSERFVASRPIARPRLAVSLVSAQPELRAKLMPGATRLAAAGTAHSPAAALDASKGFEALESALARYLDETGRYLTLEMPLFAGVNDTEAESTALRAFLDRLPRSKRVDVNVIPYNAIEGLPFHTPSQDRVYEFVGRLVEAGHSVTGRYPRGRSIGAACGQLGETADR